MNFELNEEQRLLRHMVRDFAAKEVAPRAAELDEKGGFPWQSFRQMAQLGILGIPYPEAYGGSGGDMASDVCAAKVMPVEPQAREISSTAMA